MSRIRHIWLFLPGLVLALISCNNASPFSSRKGTEAKAAPEMIGKDADGEPLTLSDYRGKVVLLDFWATT